MDLLERYLRQIKRYLPFKEREETVNELRSLILDQLDEKAVPNEDQEAALKQILTEMGDPQKVASRYTDRGPIISKQLEPLMILIMKITSITLPLVIIFADSIAFVTTHDDFTFMDFLLNMTYMIPEAMYALVISIGMIFITFALIERYVQPQFHIEEKPFYPELLPELPQKMFTVSIVGSTLSILILVVFLYILNMNQGLIGVYYNGTSYPLLNDNFDKILPFLNIGWLVSIVVQVYYLYSRKKNIASKTVEFILGVYSGIIMIMIATSNIFNEVIIDGYSLNVVPQLIKYIFIFIGVAAIIGAIVDYVKMFVNLDNLQEIDKQLKK